MRADALIRRRRRTRHVAMQRGYTLAEMGIVLALPAMIAGCACPALQRQLERRAVQNTVSSRRPAGVSPFSARQSAGGVCDAG